MLRILPPLALGLVVVLLASSSLAGSIPPTPSHALSAAHPAAFTAKHPPVPPHPPALRPAGKAGPLAAGLWYTQQGATISELNGSLSVSGAKSISLQFTLKTSPYPVGYELNGLSDTGDWYQVLVADNWPGCNAGFEELWETWDNFAVPGPVTCDPTLTYSSGDTIFLGLNYTSTGNVCLDVRDVSSATSNIVCQPQPDSGASMFVPIQGTADANGFFTGPMTEVINQTATSCPDYTKMPYLDYRWPAGTWVTQYTPWSDEFDLFSGTLCWIGGGSIQALSRGDPTTFYIDTASGSGFGARWGAGQNLSILSPTFGWRYQTDVTPITSTILTSDFTQVRTGTTVHFSATVTGGVGTHSAMWSVNGTFQSGTSLTFNYTPLSDGTYTISADGIDGQLNALAAATPIVVTASGPLAVQPIAAVPGSGGVDTGQSVTFTAIVSGGIGVRTYVWSGLPSGCSSANVSRLTCVPLGPGTFFVSVNVTDSNHTSVVSPVLSFQVFPIPSATLSANVTRLDVGQTTLITTTVTGGHGPFQFDWSGTPSGCPPTGNATLLCTPTSGGLFDVSVVVTDLNGALAVSGSVSLVVGNTPTVIVTSTRSIAEVGQSVSLRAATAGGIGAFSYSWVALPTGCSAGNVAQLNCSLQTAENATIRVTVVDSVGGVATSSQIHLNVLPRLAVVLTVTPANVVAGEIVTFTGVVSGGYGSLHFEWAGVPPSCTAPPNASFDCQVSDPGDFAPSLTVFDGQGVSASSNASLSVSPAPAAPPLLGFGTTTWVAIGLLAVVALGMAVWAVRRRRRPEPVDDQR